MKIFEVITEDSKNKETIVFRQQVSGESVKQVSEYFHVYCEKFSIELTSVKYMFTVIEQVDYEYMIKSESS